MTTTIPVKVYNVQKKPKFIVENDMMPKDIRLIPTLA